jgi:hypothetical protein
MHAPAPRPASNTIAWADAYRQNIGDTPFTDRYVTGTPIPSVTRYPPSLLSEPTSRAPTLF